MPDRRNVMLVDENGRVVGTSEKLAAHEPPGSLHLAFSVFVFRGDETLLQRRAESKYHFGGIWANACCSHPEPGEDVIASARRRLVEELGLDCELREAGTFVYRAVDSVSGRVEHEFDHVLVGELPLGIEPSPASDEVAEVAWTKVGEAARMRAPAAAPWLRQGLEVALRGRKVLAEGSGAVPRRLTAND